MLCFPLLQELNRKEMSDGAKKASEASQKEPNEPAKGNGKNGKKKDNKDDMEVKKGDELSEEDLRIKSEVELLVERVADKNSGVVQAAVSQLTNMLRTATGTMTSIPKPLKFVRPLFPVIEKAAHETTDDTNRRGMYDLLSLIAMTLVLPVEHQCLKYKLLGTHNDLASWGHEYLRHLAGEIGAEWSAAQARGEAAVLRSFVEQTVSFLMGHQDEPAACDLAIEIDNVALIGNFCDDTNFNRVCKYLIAVSRYLPAPEDGAVLSVVYDIFLKRGAFTEAMRLAILQHNREKADQVMNTCTDPLVKKQMGLICARYRLYLTTGDDDLDGIIGNTKMSELFLHTARDLDSAAPKTPEDIYKLYLLDSKVMPQTNSYMYNLANVFVNGFVNAGFGKDKLLTEEGDDKGVNWIRMNKDHRVISAAASLGLICLWDHETGLAFVDKFTYCEDYVKAGALLATGILLNGIRSPFDPALSLLQESVNSSNRETRIGAILGLGYAYGGMSNDAVKEVLIPLVADSSQPNEIQCMAALALSFVFNGTCNEDISEAVMTCLMEKDEKMLEEPCVRYLILALGVLFLGRKEAADTLIDAAKALPEMISKYTEVVVMSCAYAATGNVVMVQKLFAIVAEKNEVETADPTKPQEAGDTAMPSATPSAAPAAAPNVTPGATTATAPAGATTGTDAAKESKKETKEYNYKAAAVLGIGLIAMGEELGAEMCKRAALHILMANQVGDRHSGRRAVPLAFALLSVSNPQMTVIETLSKLSHDADVPTAESAIISLGLVAAGSNNARCATLLRSLSGFYSKDKDANLLLLVRVAQGLVSLGKGHMTLSPIQSDRLLVSPTAITGLLTLCHSALDFEHTILDRYHYMLFSVALAMNPRMLTTVNGDFAPVTTQVRVGLAVDTVAVPGKPKTITGFQTHNTPVLMQETDRAELVPGKYKAVASVLEGVVIVEEKPEAATEL